MPSREYDIAPSRIIAFGIVRIGGYGGALSNVERTMTLVPRKLPLAG